MSRQCDIILLLQLHMEDKFIGGCLFLGVCMSAIHFDPYFNSDVFKTMCGVIYSEFDALATKSWDKVTCKRCLRMRSKLQTEYQETERHIVNQMGDMAEFIWNT